VSAKLQEGTIKKTRRATAVSTECAAAGCIYGGAVILIEFIRRFCMKRLGLLVWLCAVGFSAFAEGELPRLAVVEFTGNAPVDAAVVREIVESVMIDSGNYAIISTYEIDQIIAQQGIALSSISSKANLEKLQRENIKYIVTGTVNKQGTESFVSLKILDVSNAKFVPNSPRGVVNMSSMALLYKGVSDIALDFLSGMTGSGGQVVQAEKPTAAGKSTK
jgi:hypothetical protein